ncbi:MAG TPA: periplasmic heavy metal sensor [Alphaproteobacteria bacterium]
MSFKSPAGSWLAIAFTASLAVNVFLAGLFIGQRMMAPMPPAAAAAFRGGERAGERTMPAIIDRIAEILPPDQRTVFLATMEKHRADIMGAGAAVREARAKVRDLLSADNFDRPATEAAMSDLRDRHAAFQRALQMAMLDAAEALPPDARRQVVNMGGRRSANRD